MISSDGPGAALSATEDGGASPSFSPSHGAAADAADAPSGPTVVPFHSATPTFRNQSSLTPLILDRRATSRLLELLLQKAGISVGQAAKAFGVTDEAVRQYVTGRRSNPSLHWFLKFAQLCGAKVSIEFNSHRS